MNRVLDIKSGHDFYRYRNSIQVIYVQINDWKMQFVQIFYNISPGVWL